jgi:hypothetical protein
VTQQSLLSLCCSADLYGIKFMLLLLMDCGLAFGNVVHPQASSSETISGTPLAAPLSQLHCA